MNVDGVNAKIDRAEKRLHELRGLTDSIVAVATASIVREEDGDPTKLLHRATEVPALAAEIGTIVGVILCNLRSARDHLAWQLVERHLDTHRSVDLSVHGPPPACAITGISRVWFSGSPE